MPDGVPEKFRDMLKGKMEKIDPTVKIIADRTARQAKADLDTARKFDAQAEAAKASVDTEREAWYRSQAELYRKASRARIDRHLESIAKANKRELEQMENHRDQLGYNREKVEKDKKITEDKKASRLEQINEESSAVSNAIEDHKVRAKKTVKDLKDAIDRLPKGGGAPDKEDIEDKEALKNFEAGFRQKREEFSKKLKDVAARRYQKPEEFTEFLLTELPKLVDEMDKNTPLSGTKLEDEVKKLMKEDVADGLNLEEMWLQMAQAMAVEKLAAGGDGAEEKAFSVLDREVRRFYHAFATEKERKSNAVNSKGRLKLYDLSFNLINRIFTAFASGKEIGFSNSLQPKEREQWLHLVDRFKLRVESEVKKPKERRSTEMSFLEEIAARALQGIFWLYQTDHDVESYVDRNWKDPVTHTHREYIDDKLVSREKGVFLGELPKGQMKLTDMFSQGALTFEQMVAVLGDGRKVMSTGMRDTGTETPGKDGFQSTLHNHPPDEEGEATVVPSLTDPNHDGVLQSKGASFITTFLGLTRFESDGSIDPSKFSLDTKRDVFFEGRNISYQEMAREAASLSRQGRSFSYEYVDAKDPKVKVKVEFKSWREIIELAEKNPENLKEFVPEEIISSSLTPEEIKELKKGYQEQLKKAKIVLSAAPEVPAKPAKAQPRKTPVKKSAVKNPAAARTTVAPPPPKKAGRRPAAEAVGAGGDAMRSELRLADKALENLLLAVTGNREEPAPVDEIERLIQLLMTSGKFPELVGKIAPILRSLLNRIKDGGPADPNSDNSALRLTVPEARDILEIFTLLLAEPNVTLSQQIGGDDVNLNLGSGMKHHEIAYVEHEGDAHKITFNLKRLADTTKPVDERLANLKWALSHEATHIQWKKILEDKFFAGVFRDKDGQFQEKFYEGIQEVIAYSQSYHDISTDRKFARKYESAAVRIKALVELATDGFSPSYVLTILKDAEEGDLEGLRKLALDIKAAAVFKPQVQIGLGVLIGQPADETIMNADGYKIVITGDLEKDTKLKVLVAAYAKNLVVFAKDATALDAAMEKIRQTPEGKGYGVIAAVKPDDQMAAAVAAGSKKKKWWGVSADLPYEDPQVFLNILLALAPILSSNNPNLFAQNFNDGQQAAGNGLASLNQFAANFGEQLKMLQTVAHSA